ncbi:anthranilate synthase [Cohaesibacter sp. CAU 1516]|uniref:anthranilate synthase n=1 Tax=Cohaesibacter sp. CAU 1516 TaxID=2576038 RepID=UPI0010FCFA94|nr:anthranilate synthase [Cohaesibacter sp. CAU 1516]TLP44793.1 anthranilate synthase [Cohaesibacter sp. CAU 1516]
MTNSHRIPVSAEIEFFPDEDYITEGGVEVLRSAGKDNFETALSDCLSKLDEQRGVVLVSNYEYPGRYTRSEFGFVNPPLVITARGRTMTIEALNDRGVVLMPAIHKTIKDLFILKSYQADDTQISLEVKEPEGTFTEEERSRVPTVFSVVREIVALFKSGQDSILGLYGAFGYDLAFQFDSIEMQLQRPDDQRDMVLYLPDEVIVVDLYAEEATRYRYDFAFEGNTTEGMERPERKDPFKQTDRNPPEGDHKKGEYANVARKAVDYFKRGDLFECVPGQTFYEPVKCLPSAISRRLQQINPSPYGFMINLGAQEYLVGASPEMFVKVSDGNLVETCPISGTIQRGRDAIEDSEQILKLLNSKKDESELTMCSDVDRNDKSRVCVPGSVRVKGRRQIELYSRLIHTVDHIEGRLREGLDAMDAFLSHAWAVTVTGAPKLWAMDFIEKHEKSPRAWYGGAIGMIGFDGNMNTGLTLRTIRIKDGVAEVRAGATLLYDSDPDAEEAETELKASAMRAAIRDAANPEKLAAGNPHRQVGTGVKILLVDHQDSFVHTLANYFRQTGAEVVTVRTPVADDAFDKVRPDLVVMSPGPGSPQHFDTKTTITKARARNLPIFGVCLGLQAIAEAFGGSLRQLSVPMHGKPSRIRLQGGSLFKGLPKQVVVGRYHSLFADPVSLPQEFDITADTDDGVIMAIEHRSEPISAVQFHPESIMTLGGNAGMQMIENVILRVKAAK